MHNYEWVLDEEVIPGSGCKIYTRKGGIVFSWISFSPHLHRTPVVWNILKHREICPHCSHVWDRKDPEKRPVSCPVCKSYLVSRRKRQPWPEGFEDVPPTEWDEARFG